MRKHDVRKWLHAILDLLPVILIPVFMIYSHRHEINSSSIQVQEKVAVDFNQLVDISTLRTTDDFNGVSIKYENEGLHVYGNPSVSSTVQFYLNSSSVAINPNHIYFWTVGYSTAYNNFRIVLGFNNNIYPTVPYRGQGSQYRFYFQLSVVDTSAIDTYIYPQCFDFTQMFGEGNEPSMYEFYELFPNTYYPYTLSHKVLINGDLVTYNDTDIMSQMTYQLYNSVDKYFNMGNVFNLTGVYDWFNLHIFNGSAPIYIYIVWQIVLYEFVMDLLFLLYGLFMWFIDMVEKMMDRPFKSIK